MTTIGHVLAATDLSAPARHAAERAAMLAAPAGARLELLHVVVPAPFDQWKRYVARLPADFRDRVLASVDEQMRALAERIERTRAVRPEVTVLAGELLPTLDAHAARADLLVMGARGAGFVRQMLIGSTAYRVIAMHRHPVLVVRQAPHERYRRVLVASDLSARTVDALQAARRIAPGAQITLLHAFEVPFEGKLWLAGTDEALIAEYRIEARRDAIAELRRLLESSGVPEADVDLVSVHGGAVHRILLAEQDADIDLVVMGKRSTGALEEFFLGSVTRRVLAEAQSDVLVLP